MPTYDYACQACGHEFELFQQMSASLKRKCPKCGKQSLQRLIGTGAGVIFKGGGFYETDYRSDSYKKAAEADKKAADVTPAKSDAKSDAKTDGATRQAETQKKSESKNQESSGGQSHPARGSPPERSKSASKNSSSSSKKSARKRRR